MSPEPSRSRSERSAPVAAAVAVAVALFAAAPAGVAGAPRILVALVVAVAVVALLAQNPSTILRSSRWSRVLAAGVGLVLAVAILAAMVELVVQFGEVEIEASTVRAVLYAVQLLVAHVIAFGLLFWLLDRGGPVSRRHHIPRHEANPDFDFDLAPAGQSATPHLSPALTLYLELSLRTAVAVVAPRKRPGSRHAAALMAVESFATFALLAGVVVRIVVG